jgi:hypothetical protein
MRPSYSNEYYLYYITVVLTDVQTWNSLNKLFNERTQKKKKIPYYYGTNLLFAYKLQNITS